VTSTAVESFEMQTENRLLDDLARMMTGAAGTFAGMGREAQASMRERMREWMGGLDFVSRDEFEAMKAMAAAARDEADALRARLDALEARSGGVAQSGAGEAL
jgi:BMFP domain-containing protein YqiC